MHTHTHIAPLLQFHVAHKVQNSECCTNTFCCCTTIQLHGSLQSDGLCRWAANADAAAAARQAHLSRQRLGVRLCVCVSVCERVHAVTDLHAYMHAHIHACAHTCMRTYMHTSMPVCMHEYMHTSIRVHIQSGKTSSLFTRLSSLVLNLNPKP
jgi:hypothetical protein